MKSGKKYRRIIISCAVTIFLILIFIIYFNNINRKQYNNDYSLIFSEELRELESYNGIRDVSQAPAYVNQDKGGINMKMDFEDFLEIHNFQSCVDSDYGRFHFGTKQNGVVYLGDVVYQNGKYYLIFYNTQTGEYTITEYDKRTYEKGIYTDESNLIWDYTDCFLEDENEERRYLFTLKSIAYPDVPGENISDFIYWVRENYKKAGDLYKISVIQDIPAESNITDDLECFVNVISNNPNITAEYRYIEKISQGICSVCFSEGKYYFVSYILQDNYFLMYTYDNMYIKADRNGDFNYILSNLEDDFEYAKNKSVDDTAKEYVFLIPVDK